MRSPQVKRMYGRRRGTPTKAKASTAVALAVFGSPTRPSDDEWALVHEDVDTRDTATDAVRSAPPPVKASDTPRGTLLAHFQRVPSGTKRILAPAAATAAAATAAAAASPRKRARPTPPVAVQYTLDAGQARLGPRQCAVCEFLFSPGVADDEALHAAHHAKYTTQLRFPGWKTERVVWRSTDGDTADRIVLVTSESHHAHRKRVGSVLSVVDEALGFVRDDARVFTHAAADTAHAKPLKCFLFVRRGHVIGVVVMEQITTAYRVADSGAEGVALCVDKTAPERASFGVSRVWVAPSARRERVAWRLLDVARRHVVYGQEVARERIAFSTPTQDGTRLARAFTGCEHFLVYEE